MQPGTLVPNHTPRTPTREQLAFDVLRSTLAEPGVFARALFASDVAADASGRVLLDA